MHGETFMVFYNARIKNTSEIGLFTGQLNRPRVRGGK